MPDWRAETRSQLGDAVRELEAVQYRLLRIAARLGTPQEDMARLLEEDPPDAMIQMRSTVECVLMDRISPALRELVAAKKSLRDYGRKPAK